MQRTRKKMHCNQTADYLTLYRWSLFARWLMVMVTTFSSLLSPSSCVSSLSLSFAQHATSGLSSQRALLFLLASTPPFFRRSSSFFVKRPTTRTARTTTQCNNTLFSLIIIIIIIGIPRAEDTSISSCQAGTGTRCAFTCGALCSISAVDCLCFDRNLRERKLRSDRPLQRREAVALSSIALEHMIVLERVAENAPADMMMIMRRNCFLLRLIL